MISEIDNIYFSHKLNVCIVVWPLQVKIMKEWDPTGRNGPKIPLPDVVKVRGTDQPPSAAAVLRGGFVLLHPGHLGCSRCSCAATATRGTAARAQPACRPTAAAWQQARAAYEQSPLIKKCWLDAHSVGSVAQAAGLCFGGWGLQRLGLVVVLAP